MPNCLKRTICAWIAFIDSKVHKTYYSVDLQSHRIVLFADKDELLKTRFFKETERAVRLVMHTLEQQDLFESLTSLGHSPAPTFVSFHPQTGICQVDFGLLLKECEELNLPLTEFYGCLLVQALSSNRAREQNPGASPEQIRTAARHQTLAFAASTGAYAPLLQTIIRTANTPPNTRSYINTVKEVLSVSNTEHLREERRRSGNN